MPFTIRQLRYAVAAADHRSFHRAAKSIGVEQSNLGRHINTLERVVGVQLFTRSRAGVTPTRAGDSFLQAARRIIIQSDQMTRAARAAGQGRQGGLTLGHNSPLYMSNLRTALITWNDSHPEVEIARLEDNRQALFAGLDSGEIDIVIVTGEVAYEGIRRESLWSERVLIAMPTSHCLADRDLVRWSEIRRDTFILPIRDPGPEIRDMLVSGLASPGFTPDVRLQSVSGESIMSVLGSGTAITVTRDGPPTRQYSDVVLKEVHDERSQTLIGYSGYWRSQNENPVLKRFLAFLEDRHALSFAAHRAAKPDLP